MTLPFRIERSAGVKEEHLVPCCLQVSRQIVDDRYDSPALGVPGNDQQTCSSGLDRLPAL